jgi:penicillin-binding protein 1A
MLLRFAAAAVLLLFMLCGGIYYWISGELKFISHYASADLSYLDEDRKGVSFSVYASDGTVLEKKTFIRSEPFTPEEADEYMDWFHALDLEVDGEPYPENRVELLFAKHMKISDDALVSFVANMQAEKIIDKKPLRGLRKTLLKHLTADMILREKGLRRLYSVYAGNTYVGENTFGVKAGAKTYFGKPFFETTLKERAFLFGMLKDSSRYEAYENFSAAERRAQVVLYQLYADGRIDRQSYEKARDQRLVFNPEEDPREREGEYLKEVREELRKLGVEPGTPCEVYTFIDPDKVQMLRKTVRAYMDRQDKGLQSAFVLADFQQGGIVAAAGSRDGESLKRAFKMKRQIGSTFKPIVYATAFENGFRPTYNIVDKPYTYHLGRSVYAPKNFEELYMGKIPLRKGLVYSLNNATIQIARRTGLGKVSEMAMALGMAGKIQPFLAMPLGIFPTSPANLAEVYSSLANYGVHRKTGLVKKVIFPDGKVIEPAAEGERVMSARAAYQTLYIMKDVARIGTARGAGLMSGTAAKTGTTDEYRDAWTVAVFPPYVAVAWVGYDNSVSMGEKGTGGSKAAPLIAAVQREMFDKNTKFSFEVPEGIVFKKVASSSGYLLGDKCGRVRHYTEALCDDNLPDECSN